MVPETKPASSRKSTDIAVIGIGCLFPDANGLDEFWQNIKSGHDAIGPVPASHWRPDDYFDADPKKPDHTYAKTGGFLKPYAFDPLKFGMAPHTLEATDSTQLLGMVCAHEALVDAGYGPERAFDRDRVSCVIGVTGTLELVIPLGARLGHPIWKAALAKAGVPNDKAQEVMDEIAAGYVPWQEASFPGLLGNVVAGRIASRLDLGGTNSVVDAACASSLAALHLAVMELQSGRADMVITGGMDTFNDIFMYMCFSKTPALSPTGSARPYDAEGDGTILGEGLGAVILKRWEDAQRDGDRIYGVLRSVGSSSDGKGQAIYAPSAKGQAKALGRAYEQAGLSARSIELVEGHGTGTKVGDGVELEALARVYREADAGQGWCQLGSVKSQVGHTKAAAGAAGLIKALMALHHKILPPTIKVKEPHPKLVDGPFILSDKARPWVGNKDYPRRAAVSAFGFGGSNYHAVLEEYASEKAGIDWDPELQILAFSADHAEGLLAAVREARAYQTQGGTLRGLGRLLRQRFQAGARERIGFLARGWEQTLERLQQAEESLLRKEGKDPAWLYRGQGTPGKLAFVFAGQGSQEPGMLRELSCLFPEFLDALQSGNEVLESLEPGALRLSDRIYPPQAFDEAKAKEQRQQLTETRSAQLALGTLGSALIKVLRDFAVLPDAVAGHSYGELLALHAAGVLDRADLLRLSYERGRLMKELGKPQGAMLAVMADEAAIRRVLDENGLVLEWANFNADQQIVLGADEALCQKAAVAFKKAGIVSRRLEVSTAFHTSFVEPAADAFLDVLQAVPFGMAGLAVYANLSGGLYPSDAADQKVILSRQLAQPVRFAAMLKQMQADGVRTFIEVGPQKKLLGLLKAAGNDAVCVSLDADAGSSISGLGQLLVQLACLGYGVDLAAWDAGAEMPLPTGKKNFTVTISGANYRNPRVEKKAVVVDRPAAVGKSLAVDKTATVGNRLMVDGPAAVDKTAPMSSRLTANRRVVKEQVEVKQAAPVSVPVTKDRFPREGSMSSSHDSWQRLEKIMQDMHDIQRKTADAHTLFLENQRQFQSMLQGLMTGENVSVPARPVAQPQALAASPKVTRPVAPQQPVAPAPAPRQAVTASPQVTKPVVQQPVASVVATPKPVAARDDDAVFAVLSQCTGYPGELLKPEMNLEGDLGIDSIKKVEIFSQLQTRFPHMEGDASRLGELQTIADLLRLTQQTPVVEERVGAWAAGTVALAASTAAADQQSILEVVAEKTGFPVAMLQPGMELEADLGIDSIKKVEIFSVIQERLPQLAGLGPDELNRLQRMSDLFELLGSPVTIEEDEETTQGSEVLVFQVLADKTGYPREVLADSMNLEADLGIDSIKRVEIFSALAELIPGLQGASQDKVAALETVGDLIQLARGGIGGLETMAEQSLLETDHRHADWDLSKKKSPTESPTIDRLDAGLPMADTSLAVHAESSTGTLDGVGKAEATFAEALSAETQHDSGEIELSSAEAMTDIGETAIAAEPWTLDGVGDAAIEHAFESSEDQSETLDRSIPHESRAGAVGGSRVMTLAEALEADDYESEGNEDVLDILHLQRLEAEIFVGKNNARTWQAGTEIWIGDDGSNLARNIMLKLQERGLRARLVSLAQVDRLQIPQHLHGLILLAPLKLEVPPIRWLGLAFKLLRRCAPALRADVSHSLVAVVTRNGGRFGLDGLQNGSQVFGGALSAFAKTIAEEWTGIHARALDLGRDFTDGIEAALRCLDGILLEGPVELGISRDQVYQLSLHDQTFPLESSHPTRLQKGDLILVTGGARGVTAASLLPLAQRWQPHLVIWGRTALGEIEEKSLQALTEPAALKRALLGLHPELANPRELEAAYRQLIQQREIRANIQQLEAAGATVHYEVVDVSKDAELRAAFQQLLQHHGVPQGIIHGAGVIRDKLIQDQKDEEFFEVLDTKLRLLPYIEECAKKGLRWALLFSSSTARLGRKGQVAYGVANEALNKFAQYLSSQYRHCQCLAFNWGPWAGGMVHDGLKKIFAAEGVATIPLHAGAALVQRVLEYPHPALHELMVLAHHQPLESKVGKLAPEIAQFSISVANVPVLLDHVIKQRAVVPAALLLEWMAAAAQKIYPELHLQKVNDFKVWKGIVLDADQNLPIWIEQTSASDAHRIEVILCSETPQHKKIRHARAELIWDRMPTAEPQLPAVALPLDPLWKGLDPYAEILFHGEQLHLIQSVQNCAREGLDATLVQLHQPREWSQVGLQGRWLISGEIVDAVFQAAIIWSTLQQGRPCLPAQIGQLEILQPLPAGNCRLQLRIRRVEPLRLVADADIIDSKNEVVMRLLNFEAVMDANLAQAFRQTKLGSTESGMGAY